MLMVVLVHASMLFPVYGESIFDALMWKFKGMGSDKPISTWVVRPILFAVGGFVAWWYGEKELWRVAFVMGTAFLAWFPLLINLVLKYGFKANIKITHLGKGWWDTLLSKTLNKIPIMRIWFFIWLYITALCTYYYYEMLQAAYKTF